MIIIKTVNHVSIADYLIHTAPFNAVYCKKMNRKAAEREVLSPVSTGYLSVQP